jgi:NAD(P)-dependent dehydrogenase (short-subunit alcohol dehydrogenase family)
MAGRTVLVTGATSGIGMARALGLAIPMGAHLAVAGRDSRRTEVAAEAVRAEWGGPVELFVAYL